MWHRTGRSTAKKTRARPGLRHPRVGASLNLVNGAGLAGYLTGAHGLGKALKQFPAVPTLWALAAGPKPPNPTQLLSSSAMEALLQDLRKQFKFVVIDSPPLLSVADGMILSTFVDGVIFVVESGATVRNAVTRARKILHNSGANVLGIVSRQTMLSSPSGRAGGQDYFFSWWPW